MKHFYIFLAVSLFIVFPTFGQDSNIEEKSSLNILRYSEINTLINKKGETKVDTNLRRISKYPNIIKINTVALPFNNISLLYERMIIPKVSAGIGFGYKYAGPLPKILEVNNSVFHVNMGDIYGFTVTPYGRYYLRTCDPSILDGFYAGLYFRYTRYTSGVDLKFIPESQITQLNHAEMRMNEYGVGIELGYQLILWERFSIDFLFFGPRMSRYKFGYAFDSEPSDEFLENLNRYFNDILENLGTDKEVDIKNDGVSNASSSFSFVNTRFAISFGFAF